MHIKSTPQYVIRQIGKTILYTGIGAAVGHATDVANLTEFLTCAGFYLGTNEYLRDSMTIRRNWKRFNEAKKSLQGIVDAEKYNDIGALTGEINPQVYGFLKTRLPEQKEDTEEIMWQSKYVIEEIVRRRSSQQVLPTLWTIKKEIKSTKKKKE